MRISEALFSGRVGSLTKEEIEVGFKGMTIKPIEGYNIAGVAVFGMSISDSSLMDNLITYINLYVEGFSDPVYRATIDLSDVDLGDNEFIVVTPVYERKLVNTTVQLCLNDIILNNNYEVPYGVVMYERMFDITEDEQGLIQHLMSPADTQNRLSGIQKGTGKGKITWKTGDVYEGELLGGAKDGVGKYTSADGTIYEGEFKNDLFHGKGKLSSPDGAGYEGDFLSGVKSGFGTFKYAGGDYYEGEFKGDLRHGEGKYVWANGETYTGQFAKGNMNGYGTYTWPEGRPSYTGYFKNGEIVVVDD